MALKLDHVVVVEKFFERKSSKVLDQVKKLKERALKGREERGWDCKLEAQLPAYLNNGIMYRFDMKFHYSPKGDKTQEQVDQEISNIVQIIQAAGNAPKWKVCTLNGKGYQAKKLMTDEGQEVMPYAACEIPKKTNCYDNIYEREDQIDIILSRIQAGIDSKWEKRFHCALVGEPAGGKTEVARATKKLLGPEAVLELDIPSTTQAGVIKELANRAELPRVVIAEEIEKGNWKELAWLLAAMDPRAEVRKLNFRSKILFEMKCLFIVTINNYKLFKTVLEGALASRCGDPIFFPKPSTTVLRKILTREINGVGGNLAWIDPIIDFCQEVKVSDPRTATSWCLSGKDGLLGKAPYLAKLRATRIPDDYCD